MNKILLYFFIFCSLPIPIRAQSSAYSYVKSRTMTSADASAWNDHIEYDNGLGQVYQQVDVGITPGHQDLVTLQEYDTHSRPYRTWLPGLGSGGYCQDSLALKTSVCTIHSDSNPFTTFIYEPTPLERLKKQYHPGNAWYQNLKALNYTENVDAINGTTYKAMNLLMVGSTLMFTGYYNSSKLITETTDEDGTIHQEYTNMSGNVVAKRELAGTERLTTYYVYDDCGNLRFVLPPAAAKYFEENLTAAQSISPTHNQMLKYAYEYRYDGRGNCIYKRLPGCDPVYYIYDHADHCIFSQTGVQRVSGQWTYTIPDVFGRTVLTGICHNSLNYMAEPLHNDTVTATRNDANNNYFGYTISGVTLSNDKLVTATFYDDYSFIGHNGITTSLNYVAPPSSDYGAQGLAAPKGLQTGSVMARLTNGNITSYDVMVQYYDDRGRVVQTRNRHFAEGYATEWIGYDFIGHVTKKKHTHTINDLPSQTEVYTMTYDHAGRLTQTTHQVNNSNAVTLCSNTYNELCQLASSIQGSSLTTNYTYNVRSWPKTITASTLFSETLYYNESYGGNTPRYNGNISAMAWKADAKNRAFRYTYDNFGRLGSAVYLEEGVANQHYDEAFTYDVMGNVQSIIRYGLRDNSQYGLIDNVSLFYNGNQVVHADDAVTDGPNYAGAFHFRDSNGTQWDTEYEYDKNGRLTRDRNKGIWQIQYNLLNLPSKTTFSDGGSINYQYSASGKKQMVWGSAPGQGSKSQFYLGNYVYGNGVKQLLVDGGYVTFSGTTPQYHFYVKDHLGNNRMVVNANGTVEQVNHYYAFGGLMGENTGSDLQDFKYNGKELDRLHGLDWYDYNARHMDAVRGVFTTMDPLAEKDYKTSPYAYCGSNPIIRIDKDGRIWDTVLDVAFIAYDVVDAATQYFSTGTVSNTTKGALVADVTAAAIPGLTGAGMAVRAETKAVHVVETAYKATKNNYRRVLQKTTGKTGKGYEAHHTLPQKYRDKFEKLGINIDEPGNVVWREAKGHHKNSYKISKEWDEYMKNDHTKEQIMKKRNELEKKYFGNKGDNPNN